MKARFEFQESSFVDGEIDLDADTVSALRGASTRAEQHAVLDPLITAYARSEPEALATHQVSITFTIDPRSDVH